MLAWGASFLLIGLIFAVLGFDRAAGAISTEALVVCITALGLALAVIPLSLMTGQPDQRDTPKRRPDRDWRTTPSQKH